MSSLNELIESIVLIPGSGEFVYDIHNSGTKISLEEIKKNLPNLKHISLVINWFASSLDADNSIILPMVETNDPTKNSWKVGNFTRENAKKVCTKPDGYICSGGTPTDKSVLSLAKYINQNGYKLTLMPFLLIDTPDQPWRGFIAPSNSKGISEFFNQKYGYNNFILHYAELLKGYLDCFIIGSEMKGITGFKDSSTYSGVSQFVKLAEKTNKILGDSVKLVYSANWKQEYNLYHMDDLYCSKHISAIGISAYFPLVDNEEQSKITLAKVYKGIISNEGFDYYYQNEEIRDQKIYFNYYNKQYAWKDITSWWSNRHFLDGKQTCYMPSSKPIYLTEYGAASVSGAANEPYKFGDYPRSSYKTTDYNAQFQIICAYSLFAFQNNYIERNYLYAFDARPNKFSTFEDYGRYEQGHWVKFPILKNECNFDMVGDYEEQEL